MQVEVMSHYDIHKTRLPIITTRKQATENRPRHTYCTVLDATTVVPIIIIITTITMMIINPVLYSTV